MFDVIGLGEVARGFLTMVQQSSLPTLDPKNKLVWKSGSSLYSLSQSHFSTLFATVWQDRWRTFNHIADKPNPLADKNAEHSR
jgi:hypothetical protein